MEGNCPADEGNCPADDGSLWNGGRLKANALLRLGLAGAGGLLLHLAAFAARTAPLATSRAAVLLCVTAGGVGLALLGCASLERPPRVLRWAILAAYLGHSAGQAFIALETPSPLYVDGSLYTDLAGELLRRGENPYTWDYGGAAGVYRKSLALGTARLDGSIGGAYPYPALGVLLAASLQAVGLPASFTLALVAHAAGLVLLFLTARPALQPLILLPLVVGLEFAPMALTGLLDSVWASLLVGCVAAWRWPRTRAVVFGLAASTKETPWLLVPFLLIRIWKEEGGRAARAFAGMTVATFAVINGPFLVWGPYAWLEGMFSAVRDPHGVYSHGALASLTHFGPLLLVRLDYATIALAALAVLVVCYWACYARLRDACWVLPAPIYWLTYRPLATYWVFWLLPALAVIGARPRRARVAEPALRWRVAALTLAGFAAVALVGLVRIPQSAPVVAAVRGPVLIQDVRVVGMSVDLTNLSGRPFRPRLAIQHLGAIFNPLPWVIQEGPATLVPGATATYRVTAHAEDRTFFPFEPAQVVVTDAGGDYALRGVVTLEPDRSWLEPDAVMNPAFRFWEETADAPFGWALDTEPGGAGTATLAAHDGRDALRLALGPDPPHRVALSTRIAFPARPLRFSVAVEGHPGATAAVVLDDGQRRVRIELPRGEGWIQREIDFAAEYARAGVSAPQPTRRIYRDVDSAWPLVRLTLELTGPGPASAWFGPIDGGARP